MPLKRKVLEERNLPSLYFRFISPHLSGIIWEGLRSCQSAATPGDQNGAFSGEVQTKGKQVDKSRTKREIRIEITRCITRKSFSKFIVSCSPCTNQCTRLMHSSVN